MFSLGFFTQNYMIVRFICVLYVASVHSFQCGTLSHVMNISNVFINSNVDWFWVFIFKFFVCLSLQLLGIILPWTACSYLLAHIWTQSILGFSWERNYNHKICIFSTFIDNVENFPKWYSIYILMSSCEHLFLYFLVNPKKCQYVICSHSWDVCCSSLQ